MQLMQLDSPIEMWGFASDKNVKIEKRLCLCCHKGVTEDESHFLTTCEKLEEERKAWYSDIGRAQNQNAQGRDHEKDASRGKSQNLCKKSRNHVSEEIRADIHPRE